ncbi:FRG domain-containing protein [Rheinheimera sp. 1928-s]|uniref:FRG domain-containing protein n=1 Tax=Rheinheimera sp. 1928-s TaxID=3033803 RepID=UPI00260DE36D|nr:FRG domain-containing protein [Rheinheimera sp. 1928-s]MDF3127090.1 FRG domain-containing protein [Rheinheimera sp. 1928-s]
MSIVTKRFQNAKGAIAFLESLAHESNDTIVFRGHEKTEYRLINTWQRHRSILHEPWNTDIDETLMAYKVGLEKLGIKSFDHTNRFEALEHGRHHGVPTPCLDFSYSPYVALFFAFNGVRVSTKKRKPYSVVYALNVNQLAEARAKELHDPKTDSDAFYRAFRNFQSPKQGYLEKGFPANTLQFIPYPGASNKRMQRQLGCLIYDTLWYRLMGLKDLEDYIKNRSETPFFDGEKTVSGKPILTKVFINQSATSDVFARLELMNITGGNLYDSADGVALDIKNAYNYNPKFSYLRDVDLPTFDDTKL